MYPFLRMAKEVLVHRNDPPLAPGAFHLSRHLCWPWDLDLWLELNNGRTLTLMDLGRIPMFRRLGLVAALRRRGWGVTVAGVSVRYRRRIRLFGRIEMQSRLLGWDARFLYIEQSLWNRAGTCTTQALYRSAVTGPGGIVAPREVAREAGLGPASPPLPAWVAAWIAAEGQRPWPPERA